LPNISDINGVAIASLGDFNGVAKASITDINGVVFAAGAAVPAPAAAYSVRLLGSAVGVPTYTGACMRVRRDTAGGTGDDDEADVAFDTSLSTPTISLDSAISNASSGVTATTFGQFVAASGYSNPDSLSGTILAYVDQWHDQSGNGNDAEQTTHGSQPQIYNGSAVITDNGKPAIDFDGSDDSLKSVSAYPTGTNESHFTVRNGQSINGRVIDTRGTGLAGTVTGWHEKTWSTDYITLDDGNGGYIFINNQTAKAGQLLRSTFLSQSSIDVFDDGASYDSATGSTGSFDSGNILVIGGRSPSPGVQYLNGTIQEVILYPSDQSSNRSDIETDINDYFQIGNFPNPTSGLLSTYTGAAAAYSVRQLANTAALCMRVRRDNDDAEQDFGFDANGDLDTAAIATFVGSGNNGYVSKWYDQSGNGNDTEQNTHGAQPQIYNGTAVITENGKPAVQGQSSTYPATALLGSSQTPFSSGFFVYRKTGSNTLSTIVGYDAASQVDGGGTTSTFSKALSVMGSNSSLTQSTTAADNTTQFLGSAHLGSTSSVNINGTQEGTGTTGSIILRNIFARNDLLYNTNYAFEGRIQEIVLFTNKQSSTNISGIETDINNYFSIY